MGGGRVNRERNMIELLMSLINKYKLNIAFGRLIQNYDFILLKQFNNVIIEYHVIPTWSLIGHSLVVVRGPMSRLGLRG